MNPHFYGIQSCGQAAHAYYNALQPKEINFPHFSYIHTHTPTPCACMHARRPQVLFLLFTLNLHRK